MLSSQDLRNYTGAVTAMALQFVLIYNLLWELHSLTGFHLMYAISFTFGDFD